MSGPLLVLRDLSVSYDGVRAIDAIDLEVRTGELVVVVGPNGAGKSTLLKAIAGAVRVGGGVASFDGRPIASRSDEMVRRGVSLVPEGRQVFADQSVEDNLMLGGFTLTARDRSSEVERMFGRFPRLAERRAQLAGTLSGGEQQMLAIARALMSRPRLLLLDEPSLGLAPLLIRRVFDIVSEVHAEGCTVLLVEQIVAAALAIADRAYVLQGGRVVLSGDAAGLREDPAVQEAYFGIRPR